MADFKVGDKVVVKTHGHGFRFGIIECLGQKIECHFTTLLGLPLVFAYTPDRIRLISDLTKLERLIYNINMEE